MYEDCESNDKQAASTSGQEDGSTQAKEDSTQVRDDPTRAKDVPTQAKDDPAQAKDVPAQAKDVPAQAKEVPTPTKSPTPVQQHNESIVEKDNKSIEVKPNDCIQIANLDFSEKSNTSVNSVSDDTNKSNEIMIVAIKSATIDKSPTGQESDKQEIDENPVEIAKTSVENTANTESHVSKSTDERNETRVISLDTIIRKGLTEQMPMTAKDIDNIVPNAIKQQQDANLKQSEMIAKEKEFRLAYDTSDDYDNTSDDDNYEDEVVQADVHVHKEQSNEKATNSDIDKNTETTAPTALVSTDCENISTQSINDAPLELPTSVEKMKDKEISLKDVDDIEVDMEGMTNSMNSIESDNSTSDQSFDDFGSETDTTHSSRKKRQRRKSSTTPNKFKDDASKKSDRIADETSDVSLRKLNRRGKPRKSYDETDNEQVKKKVGRKLKIQRYSGPKRPPGRPKRDDGLSCYKDLIQKNTSCGTTPMEELMALGHSLFSEFVPKKPGRPERENFITEMNTDAETETTTELTTDAIHHNIDDQSTHPQLLLLKRKPGRPKIDKESGGHIVFQNSELTVVNKPTKIKGEVIDPQDENGLASIVNTKDISIVPITKSVSLNKDLNRSYNLPVETTITSYGHDRSYQDPKIRNLKKDPGYIDDSMLIAPLDEMLEVHHVEEYIPEIYDDKRRRGRKPKIERSTYSEMTLSEPYALSSDKLQNKSNNGPGISVKKIEDLLEIPTRKPTLQDFSYPELTVSTTNKSSSNNTTRLNPVQSQLAHRAINKRIRGNRLSGSQPTYAELSESSNDVPENIERNQSKPRKVHWKQQKKIKASMKPHWTTQWKANLLNAANKTATNENGDGNKIIATDATSTTSSTQNSTTEQTPSDPIKSIESSTQKTEAAHKEFDESVKELLQTRQKRIPKLKYSSYDFKVRRDPNKPKMVLKFKKKYYKKKKCGISTPNQSQDSHEIPSIPQTESDPPIRVHKKPGPKPKPKLPITNQYAMPSSKSSIESTATTTKEPDRIKRKYVRKSVQLPPETHQDEPNPISAANSDSVDALPNTKRKLIDDSSFNSTTQYEQIHKRLKINKSNDTNDQSTSKIYLENYNKALQDRNHILLEILEQRSAEVRSLKMQVSSMTKSDDESKAAEKKDNIEESWSPVELSKAYSLQKLNKSFYSYVQDRFSPPLPPSIDIDRFIDGISITRGLLTSMMQILEFDGETMSEVERVTILQISELKMASMYEYDDNLDNIVGPHSSMTVVVAKGLYSDWSQAVYLNFDVPTIKSILNMIIEELHKIKFSVIACVCKYVDGEPSAWNEYGIGMGCNYFSHPVTTDFIYTFYYIDDLMQAIRNNFVENGFMTDTCRINMSPLVELIKTHDLRFPIRSETLTSKCESISDIVELFSKQTSTLLRLLMPNNELATNLADFCVVLSSFYQLMNTVKTADILDDKNLAKLPYGKNLEYQNDILNETQLHFYKLRCPGASKMSDFQRATMMCIESLKMLQHSTKQKYKMDSFGTQNITREYLKKRLSQKLIDGNETMAHLSPMKSINVIKDIFLQAKSAESLIYETTVKLFFDDEIDTSLPESHYVNLLIEWIAEKYEKKHTNSSSEDFNKKMHKFEELFQSIQNPQFKIVESAVTKVFKKLKSHTFGLFLEVIHKFVVQRHLLRIKYLNAMSSKNMV